VLATRSVLVPELGKGTDHGPKRLGSLLYVEEHRVAEEGAHREVECLLRSLADA
jgi:hypothetical protein